MLLYVCSLKRINKYKNKTVKTKINNFKCICMDINFEIFSVIKQCFKKIKRGNEGKNRAYEHAQINTQY